MCWISEDISQEALEAKLSIAGVGFGVNIASIARLMCSHEKDIILKQSTPIRVMHRRTLAVRERAIYSISARRLEANFVRINLLSQAGKHRGPSKPWHCIDYSLSVAGYCFKVAS